MTGALLANVALYALPLSCSVLVIATLLFWRERQRNPEIVRIAGSLARNRGRRLAEKMRLLRMAEELANLGMWQYFPAQQRQEWSTGMKELFGLNPSDELLDGDAETLLASCEIDLVAEAMKRKSRRGVFGLRMQIQRIDGTLRDIKVRACHINSDHEQSHRIIGAFMDVTDHARRERRLKESREIALHEAKRARELAETDALTGLANRRRVMGELDRLVLTMGQQKHPLSLIIFDVDHFKQVNDRYGHAVGDEVLRQLAEIAREQSREGDVIGRIGGEEFVWVLPGASVNIAKLAAERLRLAVAMGSGVGDIAPATISIGVAAARPGDTALSLFARADEALYDAKGAGRNTVRLAA